MFGTQRAISNGKHQIEKLKMYNNHCKKRVGDLRFNYSLNQKLIFLVLSQLCKWLTHELMPNQLCSDKDIPK